MKGARLYSLGAGATTYLREQLGYGRSLSKNLQTLPLEAGLIVTCLPDNVDEETLYRFDSGGLDWSNVDGDPDSSYRLVQRYFHNETFAYAVFEDTLARRGDPWLKAYGWDVFFYGQEVYPFIRGTMAEPEGVRMTMRGFPCYPFLGVLARIAEPEPRNRQSVSAELLSNISGNTDYILIGAYDGEGCLVWSRPGALPCDTPPVQQHLEPQS